MIKWPYEKDEVMALLATIERQKSMLSLGTQNDHSGILCAISAGVWSIKTEIEAIGEGLAGLGRHQDRKSSSTRME